MTTPTTLKISNTLRNPAMGLRQDDVLVLELGDSAPRSFKITNIEHDYIELEEIE